MQGAITKSVTQLTLLSLRLALFLYFHCGLNNHHDTPLEEEEIIFQNCDQSGHQNLLLIIQSFCCNQKQLRYFTLLTVSFYMSMTTKISLHPPSWELRRII